jgi:leader peptidase (prepilin peptidase) / N-methyltransferase
MIAPFVILPMPIDSDAMQYLGFYLALCMLCCAVALIDLRHGIIPDWLNVTIAAFGVAQTTASNGPIEGVAAFGKAGAVALFLWLLQRLYFRLRRTEGLGLGDVKFLAAATTSVGISGIPTVLSIAAITALGVAGGLQLAGHRMTRQTSMPFGLFLALGLLLTPALQLWLGLN